MNCCRICGSSSVTDLITLRTLMGLPEGEFEYFCCLDCGCLQIQSPPEDLGLYYSDEYYSFLQSSYGAAEFLKDWIRLNGPEWLFGNRNFFTKGNWRSIAGISKRQSILDLGCGAGSFVRALREQGYNATGADPFVKHDIVQNGVTIVRKASASEIRGVFDCVMMHHSLEHIYDQIETLRTVRTILDQQGTAIIRVPVIDSWAARHFGASWAHLDPPRHFYLHTRKSLTIALEEAGLTVTKITGDKNDFGVVGSLHALHGRPTNSGALLPKSELKRLLRAQADSYKRDEADTVTVIASLPR